MIGMDTRKTLFKTNTAHNTAHHGNRQRSTPMCGAAFAFAPPAIVALISLALAKQ